MKPLDCKTMREVTALLHAGAAEALLELFELHVSLCDVMSNAQLVAAAMIEIAEDTAQLAAASETATPERLRKLARAAKQSSDVLNGHTRALAAIQQGINGWDITRSGLRRL